MTVALLAALLLQVTPETLAELERAYDQTCNTRIYGQFDDMCSAMEAQVKTYRAELRRRPRAAKAGAAPVAELPPAKPPPLQDPPVSTPPKR